MFSFKGQVRKFGDNIDTDIIAPGKWMHEGMEILKKHAFEAVRPHFFQQVTAGDILVAGRNFGYGSHREQANAVLKSLGINVVIADSISRIYYRNCIALGIPAIIYPGITEHVNEGDELEVILQTSGGKISKDDGWSVEILPMPETVFTILEQGGISHLLKLHLKKKGVLDNV